MPVVAFTLLSDATGAGTGNSIAIEPKRLKAVSAQIVETPTFAPPAYVGVYLCQEKADLTHIVLELCRGRCTFNGGLHWEGDIEISAGMLIWARARGTTTGPVKICVHTEGQ